MILFITEKRYKMKKSFSKSYVSVGKLELKNSFSLIISIEELKT